MKTFVAQKRAVPLRRGAGVQACRLRENPRGPALLREGWRGGFSRAGASVRPLVTLVWKGMRLLLAVGSVILIVLWARRSGF